MDKSVTHEDFYALAEFRYEIRKFLIVSERIARTAGLQPQQYVLLLALRGLPPEKEPTIVVLAERLQIRHSSAVELISRLAQRGLIRRHRSNNDSRKVFIRLTRVGEALIEKLVRRRFDELVSGQPVLVDALHRIIAAARGIGATKHIGRHVKEVP